MSDKKKVGAPKGNKNAEKWTKEEAIRVFKEAVELSKNKSNYTVQGKTIKGNEYHFIGEIASELNLYRDLFLYLSKQYEECMGLSKVLLNRLEANCFSDSKKGVIKEATAIMNLKSNYQWTDRVDNTSGDEKLPPAKVEITFKDE